MPNLLIYSKPDCHLCDKMKAVVRQVAGSRAGVTITEIDITKDPMLVDRYGLEIPVLMIDGRKVAKYRITEKELRRILERAKG